MRSAFRCACSKCAAVMLHPSGLGISPKGSASSEFSGWSWWEKYPNIPLMIFGLKINIIFKRQYFVRKFLPGLRRFLDGCGSFASRFRIIFFDLASRQNSAKHSGECFYSSPIEFFTIDTLHEPWIVSHYLGRRTLWLLPPQFVLAGYFQGLRGLEFLAFLGFNQ